MTGVQTCALPILWLSDGQVPHRLCEQGGGDRDAVAGARGGKLACCGGDGGVILPPQFHCHSRVRGNPAFPFFVSLRLCVFARNNLVRAKAQRTQRVLGSTALAIQFAKREAGSLGDRKSVV